MDVDIIFKHLEMYLHARKNSLYKESVLSQAKREAFPVALKVTKCNPEPLKKKKRLYAVYRDMYIYYVYIYKHTHTNI